MPTESPSLLDTIVKTLKSLGRAKIIHAAPEMEILFDREWTEEDIARLAIDSKNTIYREEHIMALHRMTQELTQSEEPVNADAKHQLVKTLASLDLELRFVPYDKTAGMCMAVVGDRMILGAAVQVVQTAEPAEQVEYFRMIGVALYRRGRAMDALDVIISTQPRREIIEHELAATFSTSILNLWRQIFSFWSAKPIICRREEMTQSARVSEGPGIPRTVQELQTLSGKGKKRARPVDEQEEQAPPSKRAITHAKAEGGRKSNAIPTPPLEERPQVLATVPANPTVACLEPGHLGHAKYVIPAVPEVWPATVYKRVQRIPIFQDPPCGQYPDITYKFIREEFSKKFGTSPLSLENNWPRINGRREEHLSADVGSTLLISANLDYNPYVPQSPCAAGLIFRLPGLTKQFSNGLGANGNPIELKTNTVLVRLGSKQYLYVGEYRVKHSGSLTLEEWSALPDQHTWINFAKRRPQECDVETLLAEGGLKLEVYELQCVGYHRALQEAIIRLNLDQPT